MTNELIPQSPALAEATPESLEELFSRDPEGYTNNDLDRIITVLREQRARFAKAEAEGVKAPKAVKASSSSKVKNLIAQGNPEDLGL